MTTSRLKVEAIRKTINEMKDSPLEDERPGPMATWAHAMRFKNLPDYGVSIAYPADCLALETALLSYSKDGKPDVIRLRTVGYYDIRRWNTAEELIEHVTKELPTKLKAYLDAHKVK
jgi:hypothetical protein